MSNSQGVRVEVPTEDGPVEAFVFRPADRPAGPLPAVLFFMDGLGIRPALHEMAARLASHGYHVLMPNLYARAGEFAPFDVATVWTVDAERDRVRGLMSRHADNATVMRDTAAYLDFIARPDQAGPGPVGAVGYCLGGRMAFLTAGTFGERIAAAASIHGGQLAPDSPDGAHRRAASIRASLYFATAEDDPSFPPDQQARLEATLREHDVRFTIEAYPARHGFAVNDVPAYDRASAERHWERILDLFAGTVARTV